MRPKNSLLKSGLAAASLLLALCSQASAATVLNVSLNANGTSRWYDYFSDGFGQIVPDNPPSAAFEDGFYRISNPSLTWGGGADIFPHEGNWANIGTLTLDGTSTGVGVETFNITGATFNFTQYVADNDAITNGPYSTTMGAITNGSVTLTNGVISDINYLTAITFTYSALGGLNFPGTFAITNTGFDLYADASYTTGFGTIRFVWDADGTANVTAGAVPEPSRMVLAMCGFCGLLFRRRRAASVHA